MEAHPTRKLATIRADAETQLDWLRRISARVSELRPHVKDAGWLVQVEQAIDELRVELGSKEPGENKISSGWFQVVASFLMATADADARWLIASDEIIQVFAQFTLSCSG